MVVSLWLWLCGLCVGGRLTGPNPVKCLVNVLFCGHLTRKNRFLPAQKWICRHCKSEAARLDATMTAGNSVVRWPRASTLSFCHHSNSINQSICFVPEGIRPSQGFIRSARWSKQTIEAAVGRRTD